LQQTWRPLQAYLTLKLIWQLGQTAINLDGVWSASTMAFLPRSKQVEGAETGNPENVF
jgi:hypothetical protein